MKNKTNNVRSLLDGEKFAAKRDTKHTDLKIPYGVTKEGIAMQPGGTLASGAACLLFCPVCLSEGRSLEAAALSHTKKHIKGGELVEAHFRHTIKPPEWYPCYEKDSKSLIDPEPRHSYVPESRFHHDVADLVAWYFTHKNPKDTTRYVPIYGEGPYLLKDGTKSARRFDSAVGYIGKDDILYIEVMYTNLVDYKKALVLREVDGDVLGIDIQPERVYKAIYSDVRRWSDLTEVKEHTEEGNRLKRCFVPEAHHLANKVMTFLKQGEFIREFQTERMIQKLIAGAK